MKIIVGKTAGFCYGVKRAVDEAKKQIEENKKIYCLGEIVHNKQVVEELEKKGIAFVEGISEIKENNAKMIIRAHGVPQRIYDEAKENNIEIIDCTCPSVLKIQKVAREYKDNGYYIFITGKETHPEVIGIVSNCGDNYSIIECEYDIEKAIEKLNESNINKVLLISQTTYSISSFSEIQKELEEKLNGKVELVIKNTICPSTEIRQKETMELAQNVDAMIIIGGKNSSNTKKLYEISEKYCKNAVCIESKEEIDEDYFKNFETIGIMAGASTPQKSIDEVVNLLNESEN